MANSVDTLKELKKGFQLFAEASPEVITSFGQIRSGSCNDEGVLSFKMKQLIAVAVSAARKCEPCLLSHIDVAVQQGVTREELVEALNIAVLLCGGPGWAYASFALQAFDEMVAAKE